MQPATPMKKLLWSRTLLLADSDRIRGNCGHETERVEVHHVVVQPECCKYRLTAQLCVCF